MIRKHENSDSWKAGALAIGVHVALLAAMLISFNWKAAHPVATVTEVSLWDKLPAPKALDVPKSEPKPVVEEKPEPKIELKPEPKPIVEEKPKPEEPKVDIALEKKKKELEQKELQKETEKLKQIEEKRKKEEAAKKIADKFREEDLQDKKSLEKPNKDDIRKKQKEFLEEDKGNDDKLASAANASIIGEYKAKIKAKIRNNVNKTLCGDGSPEIKVEINVLPTGEIGGTPKITKSSGSDACNEAVERAIIASEPLPLPEDASLKSQFKNLKLTFTPND